MSARACGVCRGPCRGKARRVWVARDGRLVATRACARCAAGAFLVILAPPATHDARACVECKREPARVGEACLLEARKRAVRSALESVKGAAR